MSQQECPLCASNMQFSRLSCTSCDCEVTGSFAGSPFMALPLEQMDFLKAFIACGGNFKQMESVVGLSYPTIRSRLDELINALGLSGVDLEPGPTPATAKPVDAVADTLKKLSEGKIDFDKALKTFKDIN